MNYKKGGAFVNTKKVQKLCASCALTALLASSLTLAACQQSAQTSDPTADQGQSQSQSQSQTQFKATDLKNLDRQQVYASPEWLNNLIAGAYPESSNYVILEVSWGDEAASPTYNKSHIPGALHLNTDLIESDEMWNYRSPQEIEELLLKLGITKDTTVVCYGENAVFSGDERAAVALLWAGVENVKVLDGGYDAWLKASYPVETSRNEAKPAKSFGTTVPAHPEFFLSIDQVKDKLAQDKNFKLVSIRSHEEFLGNTSGYTYIDRAGEPLGAIWGHDTDDGSYANPDGTAVNLEKVNNYLKEYGADIHNNEISFYCGTGWRASIPFLIAYQNGLKNVSIYDGGWFQWQMDPQNKVQLGDPKTGSIQETTVEALSTDKAKPKQ